MYVVVEDRKIYDAIKKEWVERQNTSLECILVSQKKALKIITKRPSAKMLPVREH